MLASFIDTFGNIVMNFLEINSSNQEHFLALS